MDILSGLRLVNENENESRQNGYNSAPQTMHPTNSIAAISATIPPQ